MEVEEYCQGLELFEQVADAIFLIVVAACVVYFDDHLRLGESLR